MNLGAKFSTTDLLDLAQLVAEAWEAGAGCDWTAPAGALEWDCHKTEDHAISHVMVPAWVLASGRTDRMPDLGEGFHVGPEAPINQLVERLLIAARVLWSVVSTAEPTTEAITSLPGLRTAPPGDFAARGGLELILHAHDVCAGLGIPFEPPVGLCQRLRDHTADWGIWTSYPLVHPWTELAVSDDAWADLLASSGRRRAEPC